MQIESRPTLHSALRGSPGFILLALGLLPILGVLILTIAAPLIPTLLLAGPYWLARRKVMRGTAWILGIAWFLLVALFLIATQLPDVSSQ